MRDMIRCHPARFFAPRLFAVFLAAGMVIAMWLGSATNGMAQQPMCSLTTPPSVQLSFQYKDPQLDRHRSVRWLNSHAGQGPRYLVTGLTEYEMQASFNMRLEPTEIAPGYYCVFPTLITPDVQVNKHLVYIASELARGSCEYDVVYAHEGQHVAINQQMERDLRQQLDAMVADIRRDFAATRPVSVDQVPSLTRRLLAEYGRDFKRRLNMVDQIRRKDHQKIDTPAEYERLSLACGPESAFQTVLPRAMRAGR